MFTAYCYCVVVYLLGRVTCWQVRVHTHAPPREQRSGIMLLGPIEERFNFIFPADVSKFSYWSCILHDILIHDKSFYPFLTPDHENMNGSNICPAKACIININSQNGTKWCGSGSVAEAFNDLGTLESTDSCCRDHDNCDDVIEAGQSAHGLTNPALYTRLHCDCDQKFLACLRNETSKPSYLIGLIYFDALNTKCFQETYPITGCSSYYPLTHRCKEYTLNTTATKIYQFFDVPLF